MEAEGIKPARGRAERILSEENEGWGMKNEKIGPEGASLIQSVDHPA